MERRGFLKSGLIAGAGALGAPGAFAAPGEASRVVIATDKKVFADGRALDQDRTQELVDRAVARLAGERDAAAAWKAFVKPDDVVGIKVNCLAGQRLSTRIEVVRAIARGVQQAGVPPKRIVVWDRKENDLVRAAYPVDDRRDFLCIGNDHPKYGFGAPIIMQGAIGSLFSHLVTRYCSVIINVPVFKDHDLAGVSVALKSFFGAIHNPNKYHFADLHQAIVDVNRVRPVREKTVLQLCDATFGCYHTGPTPRPKFIEQMGTIYATRDPVALDGCVWQQIEELRQAQGLPTLADSDREPKHIALGAEAGLGSNDPKQIQRIEV
jgi:uncharacterized protein (DUF362 family)